jgi:hypothetical protein
LGDRVEKWILHFGDLKLEKLVEEASKRVPTEEGASLTLDAADRQGKKIGWRGRCSNFVRRMNGVEREAMVQGFK